MKIAVYFAPKKVFYSAVGISGLQDRCTLNCKREALIRTRHLDALVGELAPFHSTIPRADPKPVTAADQARYETKRQAANGFLFVCTEGGIIIVKIALSDQWRYGK